MRDWQDRPYHFKRFWVAVAGLTGLLIGLVFNPAHARSLQEIKASGEIRFCVAIYGGVIGTVNPPDCRGADCQFRGPVRELTEAFTKSLGDNIKPTYRIVSWDEQFHNEAGKTVREDTYTPALMASGTCDVYPAFMAKLDWRLTKLEQVVFFRVRSTIITHKSKKKQLKQLDDLAGKLSGVMTNSYQLTWIEKQNKTTYKDHQIQVKEYDKIADALDAVELDRVSGKQGGGEAGNGGDAT